MAASCRERCCALVEQEVCKQLDAPRSDVARLSLLLGAIELPLTGKEADQRRWPENLQARLRERHLVLYSALTCSCVPNPCAASRKTWQPRRASSGRSCKGWSPGSLERTRGCVASALQRLHTRAPCRLACDVKHRESLLERGSRRAP